MTIDELLAESRRGLERVTPDEAQASLIAGGCLIDIRSDAQIARDGSILGAWVLARNVLEWRLAPDSTARDPAAPGLDDHVMLICHEGYQSSLAAATLQQLGFHRATDVIGGLCSWRDAGLPVTRPRGSQS